MTTEQVKGWLKENFEIILSKENQGDHWVTPEKLALDFFEDNEGKEWIDEDLLADYAKEMGYESALRDNDWNEEREDQAQAEIKHLRALYLQQLKG